MAQMPVRHSDDRAAAAGVAVSIRDRCLQLLAALGHVGLDGLRTWQLIRIVQATAAL